MRTLIVDDELVSRKKLQKIMGILGECEAAENGRSAITIFLEALEKGEPFKLVTLDISMPPDMDGIELLSELRKIEKQKKIPKEKRAKMIMVTGVSDKNAIIKCTQADCDDYIVKPFDKKIIIEKLIKILGPPHSHFLKLLR